MKKSVILFVIGILALVSVPVLKSAVITVSGIEVAARAQYYNLNDAIAAANPNDTLLLSCSFSGEYTINKRLVLIGEGFNPNNPYHYTHIDGINLDGATGTKIQSLNIDYITGSSNNDTITIKSCRINQSLFISGSNWSIFNNIITNEDPIYYNTKRIDINFQNNINFRNNILIFYNYYSPTNFIINSDNSTVLFEHNIFLGSVWNYVVMFNNFSNALIFDNIFWYQCFPDGASSCSFINNINFNSETYFPYGDNYFEGTITEDPLFVNWVYPFEYTIDFNLQESSPGKNAGGDGTDIGIFGGLYPWQNNADGTQDNSGAPNTPQIQSFNLEKYRIFIGDTLRYNVEAKKR